MKAIALQPIWNHHTQELIDKDKEFQMDDSSVLSLIEIGAAKAIEKKPNAESQQEKPAS